MASLTPSNTSIEAEIESLHDILCKIAGNWRNTHDSVIRAKLKLEYHEVVNKLFALGWNGQSVDVECDLPDDAMPEAWLKRQPELWAKTLDELRQAGVDPERLQKYQGWDKKKVD